MSIRGPGPVNHPGHHVSLNLWSVSCEITLNCYYVRHCVGDLMTLTVSTSEDNCLSLTTETTDWQLVTCFTTSAQDHIPQLQFSADGGPIQGGETSFCDDHWDCPWLDASKESSELDRGSIYQKMLSFARYVFCIILLCSQLIFSLSGHQLDTDRQFAWLITREIILVIFTNSKTKMSFTTKDGHFKFVKYM